MLVCSKATVLNPNQDTKLDNIHIAIDTSPYFTHPVIVVHSCYLSPRLKLSNRSFFTFEVNSKKLFHSRLFSRIRSRYRTLSTFRLLLLLGHNSSSNNNWLFVYHAAIDYRIPTVTLYILYLLSLLSFLSLSLSLLTSFLSLVFSLSFCPTI